MEGERRTNQGGQHSTPTTPLQQGSWCLLASRPCALLVFLCYQKYIRLFNDDKQRYEEEMAAYRKAHPPDKHRKRNHSSDDDEEDEEDEVEEDAETRPATQAVMSHPQLASTVNSLQETVEQLQRSMAEQQQQIAELTRRLDASQPHVSTSQ